MAPVGIIIVAVVGIVAGRWGARGRAGWVSAGLVLAATLSWFAVEAVVQVIGTDNPGGFTRGEWLLLWRRVQMCLWFAFLVASQLVLIGPMRRRLEPSAA